MFTSVVEGLYRQHLAPGCEPVHTHAITLGNVLHVQEETPTAGQTERNRWNLGLNLGLPCWYGLNKPKQHLAPGCEAVHTHAITPVSYTHLRAHETDSYLVCRLLLEKKN